MKKLFKKDQKGFTLAELLIVVAIIGVLVAVSIPIFTTQLEKSRQATDVANLRTAYACASVAVLDSANNAGTASAVIAGPVKLVHKNAKFDQIASDLKIGNFTVYDTALTGTVYVKVGTDGTTTISATAPVVGDLQCDPVTGVVTKVTSG